MLFWYKKGEKIMRYSFYVYYVDKNFPTIEKFIFIKAKNPKQAEQKFKDKFPNFNFLYVL